MEWRTADGPVERPIARVVDTPGGNLDRIIADPDVTTFLNDQFYAIFREPGVHAGEPVALLATVQFFTPDGCPITQPVRVWSPGELIDVANSVMLRVGPDSSPSPRLLLRCPAPTR